MAGEAALVNISLYKNKECFFDASYIRIAKVIDAWDIFTVETIHLFLVGIFKWLKEWTLVYLSFEETKFKNREMAMQRRLVKWSKKSILHGRNNVQAAYEKEFYIFGLHVNFFTGQ